MEGTEKIFCSNPSMDAMGMAAMMNGGMGANNWLNNPFLYLIFLAMFGGNGFGWGGNRGAMHTEQFDSLRNQIADNQNNQLAMDAIKGNASAISQLATNLGCSVNSLQQAVCSVKSAIEGLGGQIGFSAERVSMPLIWVIAMSFRLSRIVAALPKRASWRWVIRTKSKTCSRRTPCSRA